LSAPEEDKKRDGRTIAIIILPIIFLSVGLLVIGNIAYQDDQRIIKLESELNRTNIITSGLINFTYNQASFNDNVASWSNEVNRDLHLLDNRTMIHK
jgi:hypothetical protein